MHPGIDMRAWLSRCGLFLRTGGGVSALEYSIFLVVVLAVRIGASVAAYETPGSESGE